MKFTPTKSGRGGKSLSHAERGGGGHKMFLGSFYAVAKCFHCLKGPGGGGVTKSVAVSRGDRGGAKSLGPAVFSFCSPPPPPTHTHFQ